MATSGKDTGLVGYNVQAAVDAQHHLIVAHEVTNFGNDRSQLSTMAKQAQEATGVHELTAIADRGYFKGEEILACEATGVTPLVPKPLTTANVGRACPAACAATYKYISGPLPSHGQASC